mmetsp:Transcript_21652/g.45477  ORF Transcript_21652/g.45477 Transcript_21652/m.45477 type:complete len:92 (-) Transcript_21652:347-622(-)
MQCIDRECVKQKMIMIKKIMTPYFTQNYKISNILIFIMFEFFTALSNLHQTIYFGFELNSIPKLLQLEDAFFTAVRTWSSTYDSKSRVRIA